MDSTKEAERELLEAVGELRDAIVENDSFCAKVYRALANRHWRRGELGPVSLSWQRAEEVLNRLREQAGAPPLELAQTGGEGEVVADNVAEELSRRGWSSEPLDTSEGQDDHVAEPHSPPPSDEGAEQAPTDQPKAWREAAREAEI